VTDEKSPSTIDALFNEDRKFPPPPEFAEQAGFDQSVYEQAEDAESFWGDQAEHLTWRKRWDQVLDWSDAPFAKWFVGGTLNLSESALDQHLEEHGDKVAYYWEGEPDDSREITYRQLSEDVGRFANGLASLGVEKGDIVAIYMGMVPELPVAMLACARLGAAHSVVFGGFSSDALRDRINDAEAKVLVTCDGAWRAGSVVPLKQMADESLADAPSIEKVVVVKRTDSDVDMQEGRDIWWHDLVEGQEAEREAAEMDAEDLLFILYTSGTTAKPKGIVHTTGGYGVGTAATHRMVFDLKPDDVYWCTADIGWVTGHSYIVYGPLINGATSVMFEGVPQYPDKDRFWDIVEKYKVTTLYTAPTAIRTFVKWGKEYPGKHDLSSLRLLGTVGEPINSETWMWYREVIGGNRCPIVDTWWQTETGMILISPLPGVTETKPGSATLPLPGVGADVVDEAGESVPLGGGGYLTLTKPWPAMLRTLYNEPDRFKEVYWERFSKPDEDKWVYSPATGPNGTRRATSGFSDGWTTS